MYKSILPLWSSPLNYLHMTSLCLPLGQRSTFARTRLSPVKKTCTSTIPLRTSGRTWNNLPGTRDRQLPDEDGCQSRVLHPLANARAAEPTPTNLTPIAVLSIWRERPHGEPTLYGRRCSRLRHHAWFMMVNHVPFAVRPRPMQVSPLPSRQLDAKTEAISEALALEGQGLL